MASKCFDPPPSTRYVAMVNGAPANPINGTAGGRAARTIRIASRTNGVASRASGTRRAATSWADRDRLRQMRAGIERHVHPHRRQRHQDVGKQDGGVDVEPAYGLQRDLARQLRRPAAGEEVGLRAKRAVFRQVASGLTHDPDWRAFDALLPARTRKQRVAHATASSDSATAATVSAMSSTVCAPEMKLASNCDGARLMPRASIAWKNRP